jgi:hypothetical protein
VFAWRPLVIGVAVLALSQVAVFSALHLVARHAGFTPHVRDVRAWAIAAPLLVVMAVVAYERRRAVPPAGTGYCDADGRDAL